MDEITYIISEQNSSILNIEYLYKTCNNLIDKLGGNCTIKEGDRVSFEVTIPTVTQKLFLTAIIDKIADCIGVNYKYKFFKNNIRTAGLNGTQFELLLCSLISADLDDDKRYIISKLSFTNNRLAIDGEFNFKMINLKSKWQEIVGYIPDYFTFDRLSDFISYIIKDKRGKRAYVDNSGVYDGHYNKIYRGLLIDNINDCGVVKNVILSGSGEVELGLTLTKDEEEYLKKFFGDKIFFKKGFLYKNN